MIQLKVNGAEHSVDIDNEIPLLWVICEELGLTGTKYSCGIGVCGACVVLVDGVPTRSCLLPAVRVTGEVTTIEGIGTPNALHVVQEEWVRLQVAQCGYCQSGQIVTAVALLENNRRPTDADIDQAFSSSLCRCGTYPRIRQAVRSAAERLGA